MCRSLDDYYLYDYLTPDELVTWAVANLNIMGRDEDPTHEEIARLMRWIGMCCYDTIFIDGDKPKIGRIGIGLMLSVTIMVFPRFYEKWELSQTN